MTVFQLVFTLALMAAIWGAYRPFAGISRKVFGLCGVGIFILYGVAVPKPTPEQARAAEVEQAKAAAAEKADDEKAAAQAKAEEDESNENSVRVVAATLAVDAIKQAARNPDSVIIEGVWASKNAGTLCINYRAQNGFGGMNRESVVFADGKPLMSERAWHSHCHGDLVKIYI